MSWVDETADADLIEHQFEVRLFLEQRSPTEFRECWGGGYTPQRVKGHIVGDGVEFDTASFVFNGPVGSVRGYYLLVDGRIRESESFEKPIPIATSGDRIEVMGRIE